MTFKGKNIINSLLKKGFAETLTHHRQLRYYTKAGKPTRIHTYISHDAKTEYSDSKGGLLHDVKKQLHLTKQELIDLIECPMSRDDYEKILKEQKLI